jgi:serine/threonine-protein kinase
MAKSLDDRYPSAAALQADLEAYLVSSKSDVSTREVGKVIALVFAKERASTRSVIEQHVASLKAGKTVDKLPSLPPPAGEIVATPSGAHGPLPRLAGTPGAGTPVGTPGATAVPVATSDPFVDAAAAKSTRLVRVVAAVGAVAALALVAGVLASRSDRPPSAAVDPIASASAPAVPALIVPATHELSLHVYPANARISIEGVPLSNPGKRTCTHGQPVTMHASAAHYRSADRELRCDGDESVEMSLEPEPEPTPEPSASTRGAPSAAPARK